MTQRSDERSSKAHRSGEKKQKVVIVTSTFPPKSGGIASAHFNIFKLLRDHFDVQVVAFNDPDQDVCSYVKRACPSGPIDWLVRGLMRIYAIKYGWNAQLPEVTRTVQFAMLFQLQLNKVIRRFNPDFILVPDNYLPAYGLNKPSSAKLIWFCRNNNSRFLDQPLLTNINQLDLQVATSMERRALKKADHIICPSDYMVEELSKSFAIDAPVSVINNFLFADELNGISSFPIHAELQIESDIPVVYIPSAGTVNKGLRYVFEIVRRIAKAADHRVAFYLSGHIPDDLRYELNSISSRTKVYAPGHTTRAENLPIVKACSVCVSPTLIENYSNALVEAICMGIPCVTFDTGGNKEIVDHGINGFVTRYLDVDALVEHTSELVADKNLWKKYSDAALQKGTQLMNTDAILDSYEELFAHLSASE